MINEVKQSMSENYDMVSLGRGKNNSYLDFFLHMFVQKHNVRKRDIHVLNYINTLFNPTRQKTFHCLCFYQNILYDCIIYFTFLSNIKFLLLSR